MGSVETTMPAKTREVHNHHMDSTIWNSFPWRSDDIIVATWAKSGTTWTQQILAQLIYKGDANTCAGMLSPWVDMRVIPHDDLMAAVESQTKRRFLKTHLPNDAMVWKPDNKYIFIGRDGRDMIWSLHHHLSIGTDLFYQIMNETPGLVGPKLPRPTDDPRDMFVDLVEDDTRPSIPWPFWSHIKSWWDVRHQPNIMFVHFNDLKADMEGEMRRIAKFLELPELSDEEWKNAVEHSTFAYMKKHPETAVPPIAEQVFTGGGGNFINKGSNGRWAERLSEEDNEKYVAKAKAELGEECAEWLANGGQIKGAN